VGGTFLFLVNVSLEKGEALGGVMIMMNMCAVFFRGHPLNLLGLNSRLKRQSVGPLSSSCACFSGGFYVERVASRVCLGWRGNFEDVCCGAYNSDVTVSAIDVVEEILSAGCKEIDAVLAEA